MHTVIAILVVAGLCLLGIRIIAAVYSAFRIMMAAEEKQIREAFLINFGGPVAPFAADMERQRRRTYSL